MLRCVGERAASVASMQFGALCADAQRVAQIPSYIVVCAHRAHFRTQLLNSARTRNIPARSNVCDVLAIQTSANRHALLRGSCRVGRDLL